MAYFDGVARTYLISAGKQLQIFIKNSTYHRIKDFCLSDTTDELGGILIGSIKNNTFGSVIYINDIIIPSYNQSFVTELRFSSTMWKNIHDLKSITFPKEEILGWFKSLPDQELIPSDYDLSIQRSHFEKPYQVIFFLDPTSPKETFFHWESSYLVPQPDFIVMDSSASTEYDQEVFDQIASGSHLSDEFYHQNPFGEKIKALNQTFIEGLSIKEGLNFDAPPKDFEKEHNHQTGMKVLVILAILMTIWIALLSYYKY